MSPYQWTGFEQVKTCYLEDFCRLDLDFSLQQAIYQNPHCLPTKVELKNDILNPPPKEVLEFTIDGFTASLKFNASEFKNTAVHLDAKYGKLKIN